MIDYFHLFIRTYWIHNFMYNTQDNNYKQKTKSVATDYRFEITNGLKFESYRI